MCALIIYFPRGLVYYPVVDDVYRSIAHQDVLGGGGGGGKQDISLPFITRVYRYMMFIVVTQCRLGGEVCCKLMAGCSGQWGLAINSTGLTASRFVP